jgi:hypothetical protein
MNLKTIEALAKKYLTPTVVVILLLSGVMVFIWNEYEKINKAKETFYRELYIAKEQNFKEINIEKERILMEHKQFDSEKAAKDKVLNDERFLIERNRADQAIALLERKTDLDKRDLISRKSEQDNQITALRLRQQTKEYAIAFKALKQNEAILSKAQHLKVAENKIERLISEFFATGVDLNNSSNCNDPEEQAKYKIAKAKYAEINILSETYKLKDHYKEFFLRNAQRIFFICHE